MDDKVNTILGQLGMAFTVRDIMVSDKDFVRVDSETEAQNFFDTHEDYDYTASPTSGQIAAYYKRPGSEGEIGRYEIGQKDLLSDGTSLLHLLDLMKDQEAFFVLSANEICGFVHFSDLNNQVMKLPLFVLFSAVEHHLWFHVNQELTTAEVKAALQNNSERLAEVIENYEDAKQQRVDRGWEGLLYFREIIQLARKRGLVNVSAKDKDNLGETRNTIAHHDRLLIKKHKDVEKLADLKELCIKIIRENPIEPLTTAGPT